jgi:hypothetical protein
MATYLDRIWESVGNTEGGGYMFGGMQPGAFNDGAYGVITVRKGNPNLQFVHVITRPASGDMVRVRDNGYKITVVSDLRTGEPMRFNQSGGYLTIMGITNWDPYDTVFKVEADGRQFFYPQDSITATASASAAGFPAGNLVDGSYLNWWDANWTVPASIDLDLGERKPVSYLYTAAGARSLQAGANSLRFSGGSGGVVGVDRVSVSKLPPPVFEAEAAGNTFSGSARADNCTACSGGRRVRFIGNSPNNWLRFNVVTSSTITVPLNAGGNTVRFYNDTANAPDLDRITLS